MELKTKRLFIRNLRESDWMNLKNILSDFKNSKYAAYDRPLPTEDSEVKAFVQQSAASNLFFAVYPLGSNQMAGYVCFHNDGDKYDLGYCFHSACHSKGYAYESASALIDFFAKEYGITTFVAGTAIDNIPSCRLLAKLGFVCVSTETVSFDDAFSFEGGNFILSVISPTGAGRQTVSHGNQEDGGTPRKLAKVFKLIDRPYLIFYIISKKSRKFTSRFSPFS